jgi:hypothetical protein
VAFNHLPDLLLAEAEVLYGPHVAELVHPKVSIAPALCNRGWGTSNTVLHLSFRLRKGHLILRGEDEEVVKKEGEEQGGGVAATGGGG